MFKFNFFMKLIVLQKLKDALNSRGAKTIRSLGKVFQAMDSFDGNRKLDRNDFMTGIREVGC